MDGVPDCGRSRVQLLDALKEERKIYWVIKKEIRTEQGGEQNLQTKFKELPVGVILNIEKHKVKLQKN